MTSSPHGGTSVPEAAVKVSVPSLLERAIATRRQERSGAQCVSVGVCRSPLSKPALISKIAAVGALVALTVGGCSVNTDPSTLPDIVPEEWALAQNELEPWVGADAYGVWPSQFNWLEQPDAFMCGDVLANGCFSDLRRLIRWNVRTPNVIRHEAKHAILWKLDDPRWRCVEHRPDC